MPALVSPLNVTVTNPLSLNLSKVLSAHSFSSSSSTPAAAASSPSPATPPASSPSSTSSRHHHQQHHHQHHHHHFTTTTTTKSSSAHEPSLHAQLTDSNGGDCSSQTHALPPKPYRARTLWELLANTPTEDYRKVNTNLVDVSLIDFFNSIFSPSNCQYVDSHLSMLILFCL
jgi:hypothetical protein